jgi:indole-3-glycerol phosphate synthase
MPTTPPSFEEIIAHKRKQLAQQQVITPLDGLRALAKMQDRPRDVCSVLRDDRITLLARVMNPAARKLGRKAAPTRPYDPVALARRLVRQGAQALVVSTDETYHGGSVEHLTLVANAVQVPVIRTDYIFSEYQVVETRAAGADGLILTPGIMKPEIIRRLISATQRNLMTVIAKVHNERELRTVLPFEPRIIAIDNRDSHTGIINHKTTYELLEHVPGHIAVITMGGLRSPRDISQVTSGLDGVLVNQDLLLNPETAAMIRAMLSIELDNSTTPTDPSSSGSSRL